MTNFIRLHNNASSTQVPEGGNFGKSRTQHHTATQVTTKMHTWYQVLTIRRLARRALAFAGRLP